MTYKIETIGNEEPKNFGSSLPYILAKLSKNRGMLNSKAFLGQLEDLGTLTNNVYS